MNATFAPLTAALLALTISTRVAAAEPVHADLEVDPTAYALSGNSLHVGIAQGHWRVDLGNFAMAIPSWVHGNDDFDVSFDGYGSKLHYFVRHDQTGLYGGVGVSLARMHVRRHDSDLSTDDVQLGTGLELGYRIALPHRFHVTPWLGVGTTWGTSAVTLDGKTFEASRLTIFPAIHLGYRFR